LRRRQYPDAIAKMASAPTRRGIESGDGSWLRQALTMAEAEHAMWHRAARHCDVNVAVRHIRRRR